MVKPSWLPVPSHPPPHIIDIDPQMAFGTGTHATTRLLLEFIHEAIKGEEFAMDIGTGTGILSIAAIKLGAKRVLAFDCDPIAVATAQRNFIKNRTQENILLFTGTLDAVKNQVFSVIFANINRIEILKILPMIPELLDYKGKIFISGILVEEEDCLRSALFESGFEILQTARCEEWIAIHAQIMD